ncbi:unnamed protein product [Amoebophrya sp. A120]|nr:unnamed protein product [Amoebophrya sp. A120]|eukprot:GSA120T00009827001.1
MAQQHQLPHSHRAGDVEYFKSAQGMTEPEKSVTEFLAIAHLVEQSGDGSQISFKLKQAILTDDEVAVATLAKNPYHNAKSVVALCVGVASKAGEEVLKVLLEKVGKAEPLDKDEVCKSVFEFGKETKTGRGIRYQEPVVITSSSHSKLNRCPVSIAKQMDNRLALRVLKKSAKFRAPVHNHSSADVKRFRDAETMPEPRKSLEQFLAVADILKDGGSSGAHLKGRINSALKRAILKNDLAEVKKEDVGTSFVALCVAAASNCSKEVLEHLARRFGPRAKGADLVEQTKAFNLEVNKRVHMFGLELAGEEHTTTNRYYHGAEYSLLGACPVAIAIQAGNYAGLDLLLKKGFPIDRKPYYTSVSFQPSLLQKALCTADNGQRKLMEAKASAVTIAIEGGDLNALQLMLDNGALARADVAELILVAIRTSGARVLRFFLQHNFARRHGTFLDAANFFDAALRRSESSNLERRQDHRVVLWPQEQAECFLLRRKNM